MGCRPPSTYIYNIRSEGRKRRAAAVKRRRSRAAQRRELDMSAFLDSYVSRVLLATAASERGLHAAVRHCRWLRPALLDPYRPEQHYMRGPGPKWREKYARHAGR